MSKTLSGSAIISYGSTLPPAASTPAGALFYKTDSTGGSPQGLYMFGFVKDINPNALGSQVALSWLQVVSPDVFVLKGGDTMLGPLTVPSVLKVTQNNTTAQRILIGYQGGGGMPIVIEGTNGAVTIGTGSNWSTGGTIATPGLGIVPSAGANGLTWQNNKVWHAGPGGMGAGSGLDADLLDGQDSLYYRNASNMNSGTLAVARGGTGSGSSLVAGGVIWSASTTAMNSTPAGTAGQVLLSGGPGQPVWTNQSALSVGFATNANSANSANTATTATTASVANSTPWAGITGLSPATGTVNTAASVQTFANSPANGVTTHVRPSYFFDFGNAGSLSPTPNLFPNGSVSGFDGYFTSDLGQYQVGLTVMGFSGGVRGFQLTCDWNHEEAAPSGGLRYRVNDDSGVTGSWGALTTLYDTSNLTGLHQLSNATSKFVVGSTTALSINTNDSTGSPTYVLGSNDGVTFSRFGSTRATVVADNTNATYYPTFSAAQTGGQEMRTTSNITFNPGTGTVNATFFNGRAASANYADLAERYTADADYPVGTVMVISLDDDFETTQSFKRGQRVLGVVSEKPAYLMNADCSGPALALRGRVPVYVTGPVNKGDLLIAEDDGSAVVQTHNVGKEFAQALVTDLRTERRLVECAVF